MRFALPPLFSDCATYSMVRRDHWRGFRQARLCTLTWKAGYIDSVALSADGNKLDGSNQNGTRVTATRKTYKR